MQETTLERCVAVAHNPPLFNVYSSAATLLPEHAEELVHTDPAVSNFLTAVSQVLSALRWLSNKANLNAASILQLSQLAAALPDMDECHNCSSTVEDKLIDMQHQFQQCCLLLSFLGSDNAMRLGPAARAAAELRTVVTLQESAAAQQMDEALRKSQELFLCSEPQAFVMHFVAKGSALFDAYLQHSWQHEIDALLGHEGQLSVQCGCWASCSTLTPPP